MMRARRYAGKYAVWLIFFTAAFLQPARSYVKEIGTPYIRNFTKRDYYGGTQNWGIAQDDRGFMYFANNEGLLIFDGARWTLYKMPNMSMVRSVYIGDEGTIYVGAYNEFGCMIPKPNGQLAYHSFRSLVPAKYRNFDDVWRVYPYGNKIVFQSYNALYLYEEGEPVTVIEAPARFRLALSTGDRIFVNDIEEGLFELQGEDIVPVPGVSRLRGEDISAMLPFDAGRILITTTHKGLFLYDGADLKTWNVPVNHDLIRYQIFHACRMHGGHFAFGTIQNGLIITDSSGKTVQHINRESGLQNNTILSVFADRDGNIWLGLDNGIDYITTNSQITFLQSPEGFGTGYTAAIHQGMLYLGTNQGLYACEWENGKPAGDFRIVPGTYGQVWYLGVHRGLLVCGHNYGTFLIEGEKARWISDIPGGWKYFIPEGNPDKLLGGTYNGLILFGWEDREWKFKKRVAGFDESFRVFEEDENEDIWMTHGFKGVYRIRLNPRLDSVASSWFYGSSHGFPSNYAINVFKIRGKIIFVSEQHGIFEYNEKTGRFDYSVYFNQIMDGLKYITYLREDSLGNIWVVSENRLGVFRIREDQTYRYVSSPFTQLTGHFIHGWESVYLHSGHVFIGIEDGFAHYLPEAEIKPNTDFAVYITMASAASPDSVFYYGNVSEGDAEKQAEYWFPYKRNSFRFSWTAPVYDRPENIEYSYRLSGLSQEWSDWTANTSVQFSHLHDGDYVFTVKARNQLGIESLSDSIRFTVLRPWYRSALAVFFYFVAASVMAYLFYLYINRRIETSRLMERQEQWRIYNEKEKEYIRQALLAEKDIISMKNEKLSSEMKQRDRELANQAMNLVKKNEFLLKIKKDLEKIKLHAGQDDTAERISSLMNRINREVGSNKQRHVFEKAFDEVHEEFLNRLKNKYPGLTPTEIRVCAYLKMNISTKEIAALMNITVRGVETCRYRIRKKMKIDRSVNLTTHLLNI